MNPYPDKLAEYNAHFAHATLTEHGAAPVRLFQLRTPGETISGGVDILITEAPLVERVVITGDLCPHGSNAGIVSNVGVGLDWFAGRFSSDYLCTKFMRKTWVPALALEVMRGRLKDAQQEVAEATDDEDQVRLELRVALLENGIEEAAEESGDSDDPTRSAEAFSEWYAENCLGESEDTGFGYDPEDAALLVSIQAAFARLWWARQEEGHTLTGVVQVATEAKRELDRQKARATLWAKYARALRQLLPFNPEPDDDIEVLLLEAIVADGDEEAINAAKRLAELQGRPLKLFRCDGDIYVAASQRKAVKLWEEACGVPDAFTEDAEEITDDPLTLDPTHLRPGTNLKPRDEDTEDAVTRTLAEWAASAPSPGLFWERDP